MMTPLPSCILHSNNFDLVPWRIDKKIHAATWDSGYGALLSGGRWNSKGQSATYCSLDPSTSIIEVAVHLGFNVLDTNPYILTSIDILDLTDVFVVQPEDIPNPAWLHGGMPSIGQQKYGGNLISTYSFVIFPSAVSKKSWNLVFSPEKAHGKYRVRSQSPLVLDTRLNPGP